MKKQEFAHKYSGKRILIEKFLRLEEIPAELTSAFYFDVRTPIELLSKCKLDGEVITVDSDYINRYERQYSNSKVNYYSEIIADSDSKVIINIHGEKGGKLWINDICVSIHEEWSRHYVTVSLKKGLNTIFYQNLSYQPSGRFSIQVLNYDFETSDDYQALSNVGTAVKIGPTIVVHDKNYNPYGKLYKILFLNGSNDKCIIRIRDSELGAVREFDSTFGTPVEINLDELRTLHPNTFRHSWIGCFDGRNPDKFCAGEVILLFEYAEMKAKVEERLLKLCRGKTTEFQSFIKSKIKAQNSSEESYNNYMIVKNNSVLADSIEKGEFRLAKPTNQMYSAGVHENYIHLELDDNPVRILYKVPENYTLNRKYPAFISLSTVNEGNYSWHDFENDINEDFFCFDVSGKGMTGGGYIGEASSLEIINWILTNYSIDRNRLYLIGYSNGAYAVFALAQSFPDLAAAIYPVGGLSEKELTMNLSNITVIQPVSRKDNIFRGNINAVKNSLQRYGNYRQYKFDGLTHIHLDSYQYHRGFLNDMLKVVRNPHPTQINFKTRMNRHLKSYWVKLQGISKGKKFASVKTNIVDANTIIIYVKNSCGITIYLPPQIEKESFSIIINRQKLDFSCILSDTIILRKKTRWSVESTEQDMDIRKGAGILDVYMGSVRIIMPNTSKTAEKIAENFSRPFTNGNSSDIYTAYPIIKDNDFHILNTKHNLIVIDTNNQNVFSNEIKSGLQILYNNNGFEYLGKRYEGEYSILQSIPNPQDSNCTILVISSNNEKLLRKNIFIRKPILPYYTNGIHPFLNHMGLIYYNNKYFGIYEWGASMEEI